MAGLFPLNGVVAQQTLNAAFPVATVEGCPPLFYRANCRPIFDPVATNAIISELINAINFVQPYDCSRLDNLKSALENIQNLCNLPTATAAELTNDTAFAACFIDEAKKFSFFDLKEAIVDICDWDAATAFALSDTLAGCFGGVRKVISLQNLKDVIVRFCELPLRTAAASDSLAGCFGGQNGRAAISQLGQILGGAGGYQAGAYIGRLGVPNTTFDMTGRTAFWVCAYDSPGTGEGWSYGRFRMGGGEEQFLVPCRATQPQFAGWGPYWVCAQDYEGPRENETPKPLLCVKRNGAWYMLDHHRARYLGTSDLAGGSLGVGGVGIAFFDASPF